MTNDQYHADKTTPSRSVLSQALKSPAHLKHFLDVGVKTTDSMKLGTFVHEYIENKLELDTNTWSVKHELYQRTTGAHLAGTCKTDEDGNPLWSYTNGADESASLTPAKSVLAKAMMDACDNCEFINGVIDKYENTMIVEPCYYGTLFGYPAKAKPDIVIPDEETVIEIKTASSLEESDLAREIFDMDYDMQAYMEMTLSGAERVIFYFVGADNPSGTATFTVTKDSEWFRIGEHKCKQALENFAQWKNTTATSYQKGEIQIPLSYKATDYMVKNGLE